MPSKATPPQNGVNAIAKTHKPILKGGDVMSRSAAVLLASAALIVAVKTSSAASHEVPDA
jgi:hypothetical protein